MAGLISGKSWVTWTRSYETSMTIGEPPSPPKKILKGLQFTIKPRNSAPTCKKIMPIKPTKSGFEKYCQNYQ